MPSKKPYIQIRTDEKTIQKFNFIADKDRRSMSNLGEVLVLNHIESYEQEHGEIIITEEEEQS